MNVKTKGYVDLWKVNRTAVVWHNLLLTYPRQVWLAEPDYQRYFTDWIVSSAKSIWFAWIKQKAPSVGHGISIVNKAGNAIGGGQKILQGAKQLEAESKEAAEACINHGICNGPGSGLSYGSPLVRAWFKEDSGLRKIQEGGVDIWKVQ